MESELWPRVYQIVLDAGKGHEVRDVTYPDTRIVLVYLWSVMHDRPVSWACRRANWPPASRWGRLPVPSTMSRRLRTASIRRLLEEVERRLRNRFGRRWCKWIDAKPLPVGHSSHDRDAHPGRCGSGMAKGYKLYALCDAGGVLDAWAVLPMNVGEKKVARHLVRHASGEGYLVGDAQYDSSRLYDLAAAWGFRLVAPRQQQGRLGHRYQSPHRVQATALLARPFGQALMHQRYDIDRFFAHLTSFGGGLGPLPNWVRTYRRVQLWVRAKIILNMIRLVHRRGQAA
jgi:hypothetical protein